MKDISEWQVPKWPFLASNAILILAGFVLLLGRDAHPSFPRDGFLATALVALGALLGSLPFIMEYRATKKLVELNALSTVTEQLADLKKYSEQISAATGQWALVQESTKGNTDKTVAAAKEVAERMAGEIREFNEFQAKLNDTEKSALRLEVEKLRRTEAEWLQVVARILDHIFALHNAAARSGNTDLAEQIALFQNACREATRRVGLVSFSAAHGETFDAQKHRAHGVENPPAGSLIEEALAPGMTFQGRLIRPALVRLQAAATAAHAGPAAENPAKKPASAEPPSEEAAPEPASAEPAAAESAAPSASGNPDESAEPGEPDLETD